jgi:oligopeptide transport system permease protein
MAEDVSAPRRADGPWRSAFRRLRKHRLAVAGLVVVLVMSIAAVAAPLVAPFDPEIQERWWGRALPPGTRHLELRNEIVLEMGAKPRPLDVPDSAFRRVGDGREHKLTLDVQDEKTVLLRVTLDGTKIQQIGEGGLRHDRVDVGERDELRLKTGGAHVAARALEVGSDAPPGVPTTTGRSVVLLEQVRRAVEDRYVVEATFAPDGTTTSVTKGGAAVDGERRVAGVSVLDVRLDGERLSHVHLLGTDQEGRDTLSRVIFGGRISLLIAVSATLVTIVFGVMYGAVSGYAGARTDVAMMRVVDVLYALPFMFLVILLVASYGQTLTAFVVALAAVTWLTPARVVRGQVLSLKRREFVDAARTLGASRLKILTRHLVPNTAGIVVVYTTLLIPEVILVESFLSFVGFSVLYDNRPLESWGSLVDYGRLALGANGENWWLLVVPATAMSLTLFSFNFLGDGLRDALDPQQRGRR